MMYQQKTPEPHKALGFSLTLFFDAEQPAQDPAQTFRAFDDDDLHPTPAFRCVIPQYKRFERRMCTVQLRIGVSGTVSTTTRVPLRVEMVMQSEPSAYSLLTPSG